MNKAKCAEWVAFGFGLGYAKIAPGTWGTLAAFPFYALMLFLPWPAYAFVTLLFFIGGVYLCDYVSKQLNCHDHPGIVWDEVVGMLITLFMVPPTLLNIVLAFLLFRLFDIFKPWPIRVLDERVHGGMGIMLDDVVAGVFACICLHCLLLFGSY